MASPYAAQWLVARGFLQIEGVDYEETFAPTAKFNTIRLMMALACSLDWPLEEEGLPTADDRHILLHQN